MKTFQEYLDNIHNPVHRDKTQEILQWVEERFPELDKRIAWGQPMFTHHGSFILGFSVAKEHLSVTPEGAGIRQFAERIDGAGYTRGTMIFRIKWTDPVDYHLLEEMIQFNLEEKKDSKSFWRK